MGKKAEPIQRIDLTIKVLGDFESHCSGGIDRRGIVSFDRTEYPLDLTFAPRDPTIEDLRAYITDKTLKHPGKEYEIQIKISRKTA